MKRSRKETSLSQTRRLRDGGDIYIPIDVTVEILKKLPTKSIVRFQFVSKQWSSIITMHRDFIDFIMTRSLAQPPRDAYFIASDDYQTCFLTFLSIDKETILIPKRFRHYLRGLVCCWSPRKVALYNPTTRQSYIPEKKTIHMETSFIGYDPLENQYKVLFLPKYSLRVPCRVFTLKETTAKWKTIQGVEPHHSLEGAVCINGIIYYQARTTANSTSLYRLMSFDVRSEEFYNVDAPKTLMDYRSYLINYQEKLGFACCEKGAIEIWVLETQGWSKIFSERKFSNECRCTCSRGVTRGGEIVFVKSSYRTKDILRVLYIDPKLNSKRFVNLEGIYPKEKRRTNCIIWIVPDYVENTMRLC